MIASYKTTKVARKPGEYWPDFGAATPDRWSSLADSGTDYVITMEAPIGEHAKMAGTRLNSQAEIDAAVAVVAATIGEI